MGRLLIINLFVALCYSCTVPYQKTHECIVGDCKNGYGVKRYAVGLYSGYWQNGEHHGHGVWLSNEHTKLKIDWKNGQPCGKGVFISKTEVRDVEYCESFHYARYYYGNF